MSTYKNDEKVAPAKKDKETAKKSGPDDSSSKPKVKFDNFKADQCLIGGKHTAGYENFVQKLFVIGEKRPTDPSGILNAYFPTSTLPNTSLSASLQLKLEGFSDDHCHDVLSGPGKSLLSPNLTSSATNLATSGHDYGLGGKKSDYDSYYSSPTNRNPPMLGSDRTYYNYSNPKSVTDLKIYEQAKPLPRKYRKRTTSTELGSGGVSSYGGQYDSFPVTPYIFRDLDTVPSRRPFRDDTRILGSNFILCASRPDDLFFGKIEKALDEARKTNSWDY